MRWCLPILLFTAGIAHADVPAWLPRYDLHVDMDTAPESRLVTVRERITWTNRHERPANQLVFNAHAHYSVPKGKVGFLAKMVEILRMSPNEAISLDGPALEVQSVTLDGKPPVQLPFHWDPNNQTALVVPLPFAVGPGQGVTVELAFTVKLPIRKGRWSHWKGVTTLAQWLPTVAVYNNLGWQPAPFIPWHQSFYNEAGLYTARVILPAGEKLACSGSVAKVVTMPDGKREHIIAPIALRDFAIVACNQFQEYIGQCNGVRIRVLALPEHEWYAKNMVQYATDAIGTYNRWFGPYPYSQLTIVESHFGWNGNECGGLVMIDNRIFNFPHMAYAYVDSLVSHEICHQWWYNVVGTNGYAETWMDEGLATYFSHRFMDQKYGKNNQLIDLPKGLRWLPNIRRDDYRNYGWLGVKARGAVTPTVAEMPTFSHLGNLMGITYDRGSRIVGMIEQRMGEAAFFEFMQHIYGKYQFRILHVREFQSELETYTGRSWAEFFEEYLYGTAETDWRIDSVETDPPTRRLSVFHREADDQPFQVRFTVRQIGDVNEPTVVGIRLAGHKGYQVRIPIYPNVPELKLPHVHGIVRMRDDFGATNGQAVAEVELTLPSRPEQISVDPDGVLLDANPGNNHWKMEANWQWTPLFTQLTQTDVTNAHDRWNFAAGPWAFGSTYNDPWYTRSALFGFRAGAFRTQHFLGGAYLAYRTNDRNIVAGVDGVINQFLMPRMQLGFSAEQSLVTLGDDNIDCSRAAVYLRYILMSGSSLYLPPFDYIEVFSDVQNRCLPNPRMRFPGDDLFNLRTGIGVHYHKFLLTPYWDPVGGIALDASYKAGLSAFGGDAFNMVYGQVSTVKSMPDPFGWLQSSPWLTWLAESRWAFRLQGAAAGPSRGLFFALGGGDAFRGFDLAERQGSIAWVASVEWRIPLLQDLEWDFLDHVMGVRNIYIAPFYDVGNAYVTGRSTGPVAHALGVGLRVDTAWIGLIERTMLRFDVAKTVGGDSPVQFWLGIQHPF